MVNPNRLDDLSRLGHLAAVGLVFMTRGRAQPRAARARILDGGAAGARPARLASTWWRSAPSPMWCRSRVSTAPSSPRDCWRCAGARMSGLTALMDVARARRPAGAVASRLPARPAHQCRRPHRPRRRSASSCCCTDDPAECARIAAELDRLNRERQAIELATLAQAEAEAMAALGVEEKGAVVVTAAEGWHPGVVGLVAGAAQGEIRPAGLRHRARARRHRHRLRAARSPASISAVRCAAAVSDGLLIKGGGHAMAAGVTLRKEALARLSRLPRRARSARPLRRRGVTMRCCIDGALTAVRRHQRDSRRRSRAPVPFGAGNPEPVIALPAHTLVYADEVGQAHVARGCAPATAPISTPLRSAPPGRSSALRSCRAAGGRCMPRDRSRSTAGRAKSACSFASSMLHQPISRSLTAGSDPSAHPPIARIRGYARP